MDDTRAFFTLHRELPREGPGDRASLDWALGYVTLPDDARILDAGCGPGADVEGLLAATPRGTVLAVDTHPPFVERVRARHPTDRVEARVVSMAEVEGPFDLIWCAGALYLLGLEAGLAHFRARLPLGGYLAISHPGWFTAEPSAAARAFWEGEPATVLTPAELRVVVEQAGFEVLAGRPLPDAAWEAYYTPLEARIAALRPDAGPALTAVLDEAAREIETWRQVRAETGYTQFVAVRR